MRLLKSTGSRSSKALDVLQKSLNFKDGGCYKILNMGGVRSYLYSRELALLSCGRLTIQG